MRQRLFHPLFSGLLGLALGTAACGDDLKPMPDASLQRSARLEILSPPGDSIGLTFSGSATLRVRYVDDEGHPIVGGKAQFKLVSSAGESTGGASLSSTSTVTDALGIARVDLVSGAERVNFRVEVSAAQAPPALFYIQVSAQGFATLQIRSAHDGPRDPSMYDRVQLRIFNQPQVTCASLDFDDLPVSLFPSRTQDALGELSTFANLAADESYTVIAWAELDGGRPLASGCLDLSADKLRSGSTFEASLSVADRSYELASALVIDTEIDLATIRAALPGQSQWDTLACPLGRSQLLLDCLADAQVDDGAMDCDGESASQLSSSMATRRGTLDASGCRGLLADDGQSSLDADLAQALSGWPSDAELAALHEGRFSVLDRLRLRSRLQAQSLSVASHRLLEAQLGDYQRDLVASDRPVIEAVGVPLTLDAAPRLGLASHGFTLRYGELATEAYEQLALAPANVSMLGDALGTEFMDGIEIGAGSGCSALEGFVCTELGLAAGCASACSTIATPLDTLLSEWLPALVATGIDYRFAMQAGTVDDDNDLVIDGLAAGEDEVVVEIVSASGSASVPATLSATAE